MRLSHSENVSLKRLLIHIEIPIQQEMKSINERIEAIRKGLKNTGFMELLFRRMIPTKANTFRVVGKFVNTFPDSQIRQGPWLCLKMKQSFGPVRVIFYRLKNNI